MQSSLNEKNEISNKCHKTKFKIQNSNVKYLNAKLGLVIPTDYTVRTGLGFGMDCAKNDSIPVLEKNVNLHQELLINKKLLLSD